MKKLYKIFCFILIPLANIGQEKVEYELLNQFDYKGNYVLVDNLGFYSVVGDYEFNRCQLDPPLEFQYSDKSLSSVTSIDLTNPLKILVFYKDLSKIVLVDNTLSRYSNDIYLDDYDLGQCILVCTSFNNGIWLYDQLTFQLVRLDQNLKNVTETSNIVQLIGHDIAPNFMIEDSDWLYINDPENGILVFDIYGSYFKTIPIKGLSTFQIKDHNIIYMMEQKLYMYHQKTLETTEIKLPDVDFKSLQIAGNKLFLLGEKSLSIYSLK
ncbi:MAG: hypothetical protein IH948_04785 [Bacteroidetes bacterium]|nr:hypothetical protein [Bacteroidota bacterium]